MRTYLLSLAAGVLVGVDYNLMDVGSAPPPVVAPTGLLGILIGEQVIPVGRQVLTGNAFGAAWQQSDGTPHLFGTLPGRQATAAASTVKIPETHS
jgi:XapX domain-containing protein